MQQVVVNGLNTYLFKDYFGDVKVMSISGMLNTVYAIITFIGTKYVSKKLGKKNGVCTEQDLQHLSLVFYSLYR